MMPPKHDCMIFRHERQVGCKSLRIGIDLDGVCYDFASSVREYLQHPHPDPTRWEFYEDWGLTLDDFLAVCHDGVDAGVIFSHGDPYPNVVDAFKILRGAGHSIHIVTDRTFGSSGASAAATAAWLDKHQLDYDSLTFSSDKTLVRLDAMVDDKPANYAALKAAGVDAYLLTRPWNQHVPDAKRVLDLLHFAEVICD